MRIIFADTETGERGYLDRPGHPFSAEAVAEELSGPIGEQVTIVAWVLTARDDTACFIAKTTRVPLLIHGTVYTKYDPKYRPWSAYRID